jgi:hypothetical protein
MGSIRDRITRRHHSLRKHAAQCGDACCQPGLYGIEDFAELAQFL